MASPPSMLSLILQFMLIPLCIIAQKTSPIQPGTTLSTDNSYWKSSPSGDFSFGFRQLNNTNNYLLSIWYTSIPDTIVWYAGADGILAPKGSVIKCSTQQGLVLTDPQGTNLFSLNSTGTSFCLLNDTGNLLMQGVGGNTLWESFSDPRDTILPTQKIRILSARGPKIYSKNSKMEYKRGKFQLRLIDDGELVLNTRSLVTDFAYDGAYYSSKTTDSNNTSKSGSTVNYDISGHMYILNKNGDTLADLLDGQAVPSPKENYYFRATLNFDGVLAWYFHKKDATNGNSSWTIIHYVPGNICSDKRGTMDGGACGFNSICKSVSNGDYNAPTCECTPKYSLVDPNDPFGACEPDFKLQAHNEEPGYSLQQLPGIDWPERDYDQLNPISADDCKTSCLNDFLCVAIIVSTDLTCWKKALPLINGRVDDSRTAFIKVSNVMYGDNSSDGFGPIQIPNVSKDWKRMNMNPLVSTFLGASVFINIFCVVLGCWLFNHWKPQTPNSTVRTVGSSSSSVNYFTYKELEKATNGFREELGRGACAIVYKGVLYESQTAVAIKKIDRAFLREADKEFTTEVNVIGKTHHRNLVSLVGFCKEEEHRMLVYEFMRNGSLAEYLFGETRPRWSERVRIAQGVARGLVYLHEECGNQIIHCDIKPQNILLDEYFEARISDFGLSKLLRLDQSQTHTVVRGTKGYVAPEWFMNKPVTVKVDVYSFGVVLLEIICCRRSVNLEQIEEEHVVLVDWVLDRYQYGDVRGLVKDDLGALDDIKTVEKLTEVAIWCIQEDQNMRPAMRQVSLMLEGVIQVPTPPPSMDNDSISLKIVSNV